MSDNPSAGSEPNLPPGGQGEAMFPQVAPAPNHTEASGNASGAAPGGGARLDLVLDIPVRLSVELGRAEIPIREVVGLGRGSVIELDRNLGETLDVRINGILIGRGEVVVVNEERLGLRFIEVVAQAERVTRLS